MSEDILMQIMGMNIYYKCEGHNDYHTMDVNRYARAFAAVKVTDYYATDLTYALHY